MISDFQDAPDNAEQLQCFTEVSLESPFQPRETNQPSAKEVVVGIAIEILSLENALERFGRL